jgi:hypothetical protein
MSSTELTLLACATALVAAAMVSRGLTRASRWAHSSAHRAERVATYHVFLELWEDAFRSAASDAQRSHTQEDEMKALDRLVLLYGSAGVVHAQAQLRASMRIGGAGACSRAQFITALTDIRRELGSEIVGVQAGDVAAITSDVSANDEAAAPQQPLSKAAITLAQSGA